ncbi:response regulator [Brevundimonas vesicularis]|uniref:response regulator n=1 Tax=Brevundimonas vesicularis TaxID=41276 RepID=UPI00384FF955
MTGSSANLSRGARVLVVDDDTFIQQMAEILLKRQGCRVSVAATGAAALASMAAPAPDLVLLDLGLPDISGLEVLRHFRAAETWRHVRILVFTASHETETIVRAKQSGASGYVCKPVALNTLAEMVGNLLDQPSLTWIDDYTRAHSQN